MDIKTYIEDLFKYLETFEKNYGAFETEAFIQTYNGIYAVFQALRKQRQEAIGVDQFFLERIQRTPLTSSDLRQLTLQLIVTFFESEADIDGKSNRSYLYCRDLRPVRRDIDFFESHLVPILFRPGSLNENYQLNAFLLNEIGRYFTKFGRPLDQNITPEKFGGLSEPLQILELARRRHVIGGDLVNDRSTLEFHLAGIGTFVKLSRKSDLNQYYLKSWNYLRRDSFWSKLKKAIGETLGKASGTFKSFRYFRLVLTQRTGAYFFYGALIILFILLAIYVPSKWNSYSNQQLENFKQKAAQMQR